MGQYYIAVILAEKGTSKAEYVRVYLRPHAYGEGAKLMEHSYKNSGFMNAIENLIGPNGTFYKSRLVWAGDYADPEPEPNADLESLSESDCEDSQNLYNIAGESSREYERASTELLVDCQYIVNHTKKQYVDKKVSENEIHPLPLLVSEGNGRGGGDYSGNNEHLCGSWARDVISMETQIPGGYEQLVCGFDEY
jgi:hypothetical protein